MAKFAALFAVAEASYQSAPALNVSKADRSACLAAVKKHRPDMVLCADKYQSMADTQAAYDGVHGAHAYVNKRTFPMDFTGACSTRYLPDVLGQCECLNRDSEGQSRCVDDYFSEGPSGGQLGNHYDIMMDKRSKCVACGYASGSMAHNFCGSGSINALEDQLGASHVYESLGVGACLDASGKKVSKYFDSLPKSKDCKSVCDEDDECQAYVDGFYCDIYAPGRSSSPGDWRWQEGSHNIVTKSQASEFESHVCMKKMASTGVVV